MKWNYLAELVSVFYLSILIVYSRRYKLYPSMRNLYFVRMLRLIFLNLIVSLITVYFTHEYHLISASLNLVIHTIFYLIYPLISVLFFLYTLYVIYEDYEFKIKRIRMISSSVYAIYSICVLLNMVFGFMFKIDEVNGYVAYPLEGLIFLVGYFYMILMLVSIFLNRKKIDPYLQLVLLSYFVITTVFITIQYFYPQFILVGTASALSILIMYLYIQSKELVSDYLTRLPNRVAYEGIVKQWMHSKRDVGTIVISLKDFKNINNIYGQKNGDVLLKRLTEYLIGLVGSINVFRYSGDKFALIFTDEQYDFKVLVYTLEERFKQAWDVNDSKIFIEANIIYIDVSHHVKDVFELVSLIDYLIEKNKANNYRLTYFSNDQSILELSRRNQITEYMKKALSEDLFDVAFQPIYNTQLKAFRQCEALIRLKHPTLGSISPFELIPLAEESGRIVELGLWVLKRSLKFLKECEKLNISIDVVSVNFSVIQMNDTNLIRDCESLLGQHPSVRNKIAIEITESIFISDYERVLHNMVKMKEMGFRFYLDDFGTGYSSVMNVMKLPLTLIKIDKSLIYEAIANSHHYKLLSGLCEAFRESGLGVLAEGVETKEQLLSIQDLRIDCIQGFLFAKPLYQKEIIQFLIENQV